MNSRHYYYFLRRNPNTTPTKKSYAPWLKWHIDLPLMTLLILINLVGLLQLYSASGSDLGLVIKQASSFMIGVLAAAEDVGTTWNIESAGLALVKGCPPSETVDRVNVPISY